MKTAFITNGKDIRMTIEIKNELDLNEVTLEEFTKSFIDISTLNYGECLGVKIKDGASKILAIYAFNSKGEIFPESAFVYDSWAEELVTLEINIDPEEYTPEVLEIDEDEWEEMSEEERDMAIAEFEDDAYLWEAICRDFEEKYSYVMQEIYNEEIERRFF